MSGWQNDVNLRRMVGKVKEVRPETRAQARKRLVTQLDDMSREIARLKYNWTCVTCGKTKDGGAVICWAHLLDGRVQATRWDQENCALQCAPCNNLHKYRWGYYLGWYLRKYGTVRYGELWALHISGEKPTLSDLQNQYEVLKREHSALVIKRNGGTDADIVF